MKSEQTCAKRGLFGFLVIIMAFICFIVVVASGGPVEFAIGAAFVCVGLGVVIWLMSRPHENDEDLNL